MRDESDHESDPDAGFADVLNSVSLGGRRGKHKRTPRSEPPTTASEPEPVRPPEPEPEPPQWPDDRPAAVRAYAWTRGRTLSSVTLQIESMLSTTDSCRPGDPAVSQEHHAIADLCRRSPRSVAEVAALLRLPLGVAKVLLGDMVEQALLVTHRTASDNGAAPQLELMERVLAGLHRL